MLAAEVTIDSPDFGHLAPIVEATAAELAKADVAEQPQVALADAGYWHQKQMESVIGRGTQVLIPPDSRNAKGRDPAGRAATTRSCAGCSQPSAVAGSTEDGRR